MKENYISFLNRNLEVVPCSWNKQGYRCDIRPTADPKFDFYFIAGGFYQVFRTFSDKIEPVNLTADQMVKRWMKQASENILF